MNDLADNFDFEDPDAMAKAREKLRAKGFQQRPEGPKAERKRIRAAVDGRSLRGTGRSEQFNFKCREEIKRCAIEAARADGITIAEWMERAIEAALKTPEA